MKVMEMFRIAGVAGVIGCALMGCSSGGSISDQYGTVSIEPIEAGLALNKPLEQPSSLDALPEPTPGGTNLGDPEPRPAVEAAAQEPEAEAKTYKPGEPRPISEMMDALNAGLKDMEQRINDRLSSN
ncbi:MAG: DUF3035 domain-containing protein [Rhodobacteraceae bacterium]|nr:DUF3035 domain-containing protein [Paracoccaceae bacterium]